MSSLIFKFSTPIRRYTNLKTLFLHPYTKASDIGTAAAHVTAASIGAYVDESCVDSCMVFVDGVLSPTLSKLSAVPANIVCCSLSTLDESKCTEIGVASMLDYVPDIKELPRNSYASDILTSLNSVSANYKLTYFEQRCLLLMISINQF